MENVWNVVQPTNESVTDLRECNHGTPPISNCPRCLVPELVEALDDAALDAHLRGCRVYGREGPIFRACEFLPCVNRRSLLDRAKLAAEQWGEGPKIEGPNGHPLSPSANDQGVQP